MKEQLDERLLERWLTHECSPEEEQRIQSLVSRDPQLRAFLQALRAEGSFAGDDVDKAWARNRATIRVSPRRPALTMMGATRRGRPLFVRLLTVAAAAAIVVVVWGQSGGSRREVSVPWNEVAAPSGQRAEVTLPDGTRLLLNSGSKVRYHYPFGEERDVVLQGEAFFDVAHDSGHPFRVHARHGLVTVLGTKFGVRAFATDTAIQVAVREGTVAVTRDDSVGGKSSGRSRQRWRSSVQGIAPGSCRFAPMQNGECGSLA